MTDRDEAYEAELAAVDVAGVEPDEEWARRLHRILTVETRMRVRKALRRGRSS
jgi:hypothetical protein